MESFVYDHKLNGERFDLFCFVFVCDCTSLAITELSYHLLSNFFLDQKKRTIKLNFILGLLGNSREILSAEVLVTFIIGHLVEIETLVDSVR